MAEKVKFTLWSSGCPKCKVLIKKLEQQGYLPEKDYVLNEDPDEIRKEAEKQGNFSLPFITDGDNYYDFTASNKFIASLEKK